MDIPVIELQNISKSFGSTPVLCDISLQFPHGKISSILGRSGEGKSVLLKSIVGLITPDSGELFYNGGPLFSKKNQGSHPDIGYLFQHAALFDSMTVMENITFPMIEANRSINKGELQKKTHEILEWVGLSHAAHMYPAELSGGMQKRAAIARTIIVYPKLLLFDEPTTGLDPTIARMIVELINRINKELHISCIIITHDVATALNISDFIAFLSNTQVCCQGSPREIRNSTVPALQTLIADASIKI